MAATQQSDKSPKDEAGIPADLHKLEAELEPLARLKNKIQKVAERDATSSSTSL